MKKTFFLLPFMMLLLTGCFGNDQTDSYNTDEDTNFSEEDTAVDTKDYPPIDQTALPEDGEDVAVITTELGEIMIRFFPEAAPKAVENFKTHAEDGYYDDMIFHRVISDFMIQGGDPKGDGSGGESIWGAPFEDEFHPDLSNLRGALSMANAGPKTNGSQFFINQEDNPYLDGFDQNGKMKNCGGGVSCHTVFGQVIRGMDTVDKIAEVEKDSRDKPLEDITMTVEIVPYEG